MNIQILKDTITQIFADGKGILAMDESIGTCNKRFAAAEISQTAEMRRQYRQLLVTAPKLNESIGGAILCDETVNQNIDQGNAMTDVLLEQNIVPGIKVDRSTIPFPNFPNEKITEGLDGLRERLIEYKKLGIRFAKWRAVITIGSTIPTSTCIETNMQTLAQYAAVCQELDIVPIVEPEVLMNGQHNIEKCFEITEKVLKALFTQLYHFKINLEGIILKPNMILAGNDAANQNSINEVVEATVNCFLNTVPAAVPAIAFLSGGQSPKTAATHLNAINSNYRNTLPWIVSFSFGRAIQEPVLNAWKGKKENVTEAQKQLYHRSKIAAAASRGEYTPEMEQPNYFD